LVTSTKRFVSIAKIVVVTISLVRVTTEIVVMGLNVTAMINTVNMKWSNLTQE